MRKLTTTLIVLCAAALPANADLFYGGGASPGTLKSVTTAGVETNIGGLPFSAQLAMAYVPQENRIYSFDNASDQLFRIDPANGTGVAVAVLPYGFVHGLAFDYKRDVLYGHDINTGRLFTINRSTGATTLIGATGIGYLGGLEYDHANDTLYGITFGGTLYSFNVTTGAPTTIGAVSGFDVALVTSFAIDGHTGLMYAVDDSRQWYEFDRDVRVATALAQLPQRLSGLTSTVPEPTSMLVLASAAALLLSRRRD